MRTKWTWMFSETSESRWRAKIQNMGASKIRDRTQIKIKLQNPRNLQHLPKAKAVLKGYSFSLHLQICCRVKIQNMGASKISYYIQIQIKMPNPSHEHPVSSKAPNMDLNYIDILCILKIKIWSQYLDQWCIEDQ